MKRFLTLIMFLMCISIMHSETVSQKEASRLANLFFNETKGRVTPSPKMVYNGKRLTTDRLFTPFYVYNSPAGGFVIISAENKAWPILGFSFTESFDPNDLNDGQIALLKSFAREIEYVRYDGQEIEATVNAWINFPEYVSSLIKSPSFKTEPTIDGKEADSIVEYAEKRGEAIYSDLYTPLQWEEMISEELSLKKNVPLVIRNGEDFYPLVVLGEKDGYFLMDFDRENEWYIRLNATEVISSEMIGAVMNPIRIETVIEEILPFEEFDSFIDEMARIEEGRISLSSIDKVTIGDKPFLKILGSGHYEVTLPEMVTEARVYNLEGNTVSKRTFKNTNIANIDISQAPRGFYVISLRGESGKPYGFKTYR